MERVALYCRVSSDDQKERETIENQVETLKAYVDMKEDLNIVNEFLDDGISGTVPFIERPAGKKLIEKAKAKEFDSLLVYKVDRFGRDTLSGLTTVELLRTHNIEIISLTEPFDLNTPTGRFQFINYLNMAELDRNNILERMFIGATRAAKQGKWLGGIVPFGYIVNKQKFLEINEDEADIVRYIYYLYTEEKMNTLDIALYMNNNGLDCNYASRGTGKRNTSKKSSIWSTSSIQRILSSTTYKGIHEYGKSSTKRKEPISRNVPAIVPIEVWEQARLTRQQNIIISRRNSPNKLFLLKGIIKCGDCNRSYIGNYYKNNKSVYTCSGKRKNVRELYNIKCSNVNLVADDIENQVWMFCKEILLNCEEYTIKNDDDEKIKNIDEQIKNYNIKKTSLENEKNSILRLYRKNIISENELEVQLREINRELESCNKYISKYCKQLEIIKNRDEFLIDLKSKFELISSRLNELNDEEKFEIIHMLIEEIIVTPVIENGEKIAKIDINANFSDLLFERSRIESSH